MEEKDSNLSNTSINVWIPPIGRSEGVINLFAPGNFTLSLQIPVKYLAILNLTSVSDHCLYLTANDTRMIEINRRFRKSKDFQIATKTRSQPGALTTSIKHCQLNYRSKL